MLRDTDELLEPLVIQTIAALHLSPQFHAAAGLAAQYAAEIDLAADHAKALETLGPRLLAALEAIGATASRASAKPSAAASRLEALRAKRA